MQNEKSSPKLLMFIIFWLGVLTGALAVALVLIFTGNSAGVTGKDSLLLVSPYTSTASQYMYIPTPPGQINYIPTPDGQKR